MTTNQIQKIIENHQLHDYAPLVEIACILLDKKINDVLLIDLRKLQSYFDFFLIASTNSSMQLASLSKTIVEFLNSNRVSRDEVDTGWVCIDIYPSVLHLFLEQQRHYYNFERLWGDGRLIRFTQ